MGANRVEPYETAIALSAAKRKRAGGKTDYVLKVLSQ